jgi:membrane protease YdiL (CAAX protease family)
MKKDMKIALILACIGLIAGASVVPYQLEVFKATNIQQYEAIMAQFPSIGAFMAVAGLQIAIMSFLLGLIGIMLARKVNLKLDLFDFVAGKEKNLKVSKHGLIQALSVGFAVAFIIIGSDKFVFQHLLPKVTELTPSTSLKALIGGVLYGGVVEEVLLRLFLMSLTVWLLNKIASRNKANIPSWIFVASILFTSLIFAVGHLPFATSIYGELSAVMLVRIILLNSIGGIGFGYLYWKQGLEYSIVAHMFAHIFMQLLFIPLFF